MKFHIKDHHNQEEDKHNGPDETCPLWKAANGKNRHSASTKSDIECIVLNGHCLACHEKHCHSEAAKQRLAQTEVNKKGAKDAA